MAKKNRGNFVIDDAISKEDRENIVDRIKGELQKVEKSDNSERTGIISKRQDFFEGRHHLWTNVVGQTLKTQEGHISAVINYIAKFCTKLHQTLTNNPPKIKIKGSDESNEIETSRAEAVESIVYKILRDNMFFPVVFKRAGMNQVRDADFVIDCTVQEDAENGKHIEISHTEDTLKVLVGWDDASGSSFSWIAFKDRWSTQKILRDFGYEAEPIAESQVQSATQGSHANDQYGMFANSSATSNKVPTGVSPLPKANISYVWSYEVLKKKGDKEKKVHVVNMIFINNECVQFIITDYKKIPRFVGHSFVVPGKPWSKGFIDDLIDAQIELNDRTGEEGDLIRVGAHQKFLVVNMSDFDPDSVKPGSGQLIFLEGENVDFRPLNMTISTFPSDTYLNRMLEHMFNIGLPKITLAAGTAPYTGRVGAIQYQPFADIVTDLRIQWEIVLVQLINTIQQYLIDYFPEVHPIMKESILDEQTGEATDGDLIIREVEFDWDNVLPLSRSDKVVDASTLRDRGAISHHTYLTEAGFRNPSEEIKKLKKEIKDPEMMAIREKFSNLAPGVTTATLEQTKAIRESEEAAAEQAGMMEQTIQGATPKSPTPPLLSPEQNDRRGIPSGGGTPTGQTASARGAIANTSQNINAKA